MQFKQSVGQATQDAFSGCKIVNNGLQEVHLLWAEQVLQLGISVEHVVQL